MLKGKVRACPDFRAKHRRTILFKKVSKQFSREILTVCQYAIYRSSKGAFRHNTLEAENCKAIKKVTQSHD